MQAGTRQFAVQTLQCTAEPSSAPPVPWRARLLQLLGRPLHSLVQPVPPCAVLRSPAEAEAALEVRRPRGHWSHSLLLRAPPAARVHLKTAPAQMVQTFRTRSISSSSWPCCTRNPSVRSPGVAQISPGAIPSEAQLLAAQQIKAQETMPLLA